MKAALVNELIVSGSNNVNLMHNIAEFSNRPIYNIFISYCITFMLYCIIIDCSILYKSI